MRLLSIDDHVIEHPTVLSDRERDVGRLGGEEVVPELVSDEAAGDVALKRDGRRRRLPRRSSSMHQIAELNVRRLYNFPDPEPTTTH
jgi:hypothetical protein